MEIKYTKCDWAYYCYTFDFCLQCDPETLQISFTTQFADGVKCPKKIIKLFDNYIKDPLFEIEKTKYYSIHKFSWFEI